MFGNVENRQTARQGHRLEQQFVPSVDRHVVALLAPRPIVAWSTTVVDEVDKIWRGILGKIVDEGLPLRVRNGCSSNLVLMFVTCTHSVPNTSIHHLTTLLVCVGR